MQLRKTNLEPFQLNIVFCLITRTTTTIFIWCPEKFYFIILLFNEKGSEAIDWFIANGFAITRQEGIEIGQVCKLIFVE